MSRPDRALEWSHLGDGSERVAIAELARSLLPDNLRWELVGSMSPDRVIDFYREHRVDLFLSTSGSEGRPVSMMEAMSCGIPVVATAAGGVPELIGPDRGWLLPTQSSAEDVASLLGSVSDRESLETFRASARRYWETDLNAERNFDRFAGTLRGLITARDGGPGA